MDFVVTSTDSDWSYVLSSYGLCRLLYREPYAVVLKSNMSGLNK